MEGSARTSGSEPVVVGRYALFDVIAAGGMATVHLGRLLGPVGFSRTVAIKRLHPAFARDPEFVSMFLDEARLAARIRHPNVVQTVDVVATKGELFLVMDYIQGESLSRLVRLLQEAGERMPIRVAVSIISGALQGLHAAHVAKDEHGVELGIVHRDVSPQNVLVGIDGMARVLDFGIAKATGRMQTTRDGQVKGKLAYMAPEQVHAEKLTPTADVYAAAIVGWEALTGTRLFKADSETTVLAKVLAGTVNPPSSVVPEISAALDEVVMRGLARDPAERFQSAKEMSLALERAVAPASLAEVAEWLARVAGPALAERATLVAKVETDSGVSSIESLKKRMLDELGKEGEPSKEKTSTKIGIGPPEPVVRSTARLESAARQAMARLQAEEEAKRLGELGTAPPSLPPQSLPPQSLPPQSLPPQSLAPQSLPLPASAESPPPPAATLSAPSLPSPVSSPALHEDAARQPSPSAPSQSHVLAVGVPERQPSRSRTLAIGLMGAFVVLSVGAVLVMLVVKLGTGGRAIAAAGPPASAAVATAEGSAEPSSATEAPSTTLTVAAASVQEPASSALPSASVATSRGRTPRGAPRSSAARPGSSKPTAASGDPFDLGGRH